MDAITTQAALARHLRANGYRTVHRTDSTVAMRRRLDILEVVVFPSRLMGGCWVRLQVAPVNSTEPTRPTDGTWGVTSLAALAQVAVNGWSS